MKRLLAAILICAVAPFVTAQVTFSEPRGARGRGATSRTRGWRPREDVVGSFWGGVLGGWLAGTLQSERPGREAEDVQGEMEPWSEEWFNYCKRRYRSFDPETGKYLAFDGNHYFCK